MKNLKFRAFLFSLAGIVLFFVSVYGYPLGIARHETFGAFQWAGTLLGVFLFVYGLVKLLRPKA